MSGIVAGAQSGGCCCQPQGCTCSNPNRPGRIVDASLTAVNIEAEFNLREVSLSNSRPYLGCGPCFCGSGGSGGGGYGGGMWGRDPNGPYYGYVGNGCIIDPDFIDGTECAGLGCRPGSCACCPEYSISAVFGNQVVEAVIAGRSWKTISRSVSDHMVGAWNWQPRQVGYCDAPNEPFPNVRIRRFCSFPPLTYSPGLPGPDPNGEYVDQYGNYTGANVGICAAYARAEVSAPVQANCYYEARIFVGYWFQALRADAIREAGGQLIEGGSDFYVYRKPCLTPFDTVLGTYECVACEPTFVESVDPECGRIRGHYTLDVTPPDTITVS